MDNVPRQSRRLTPDERSLRARIAAHESHARHDGRERTEAARRAYFEKFLNEVDPDRRLAEGERHRRATHALKAHLARLQLQALQARREQAEADVVSEAMTLEVANGAA